MIRLLLIVTVGLTPIVCAAASPDLLTMERDIRPILKEHCFDCHGATEDVQGGLDLRLVRFMVNGGESGPAITPGKPTASPLLDRIKAGEMPPTGKKVSPEQIATIEQWILTGASTAASEPEELDPGIGITAIEREFWSFQKIARPEIPGFAESDRVRTPIDAFLIDAMRPQGLSFSKEADKLTLIKRICFDLIGLPPTGEQVTEFLADESPSAYEMLVDRLLESPHYGERWARHWLDVAGYADSEGYTDADADRPWAYFYRDYVIRAMNADKPFDQFIQEQLAGDEMVPLPHQNLTPDQIEKLTATGFLRLAADGTGSGANDQQACNQTIADTIKIVSTSLLGLSVGCAQCHDHRYDPIPQKDYYALRAILEPALDWKNWRTPQQRLVSLYSDQDRALAAEIEAEVAQIIAEKDVKQTEYMRQALDNELAKHPAEIRETLRLAYTTTDDKRTAEQQELLKQYPSVNISPGNLYQYNQAHADDLKTYDSRTAEVRARKPVEQFLRVLNEVPDQVPETFVFHRGEFTQPTDPVAPAALTITAPPNRRFTIASNDPSVPSTGRRLAYARWLTSGDHPLVARVLVNRIWMHHFGRGIVGTPADFGVLGQRPTHPALLDWMASEFVSRGWSLKQLHKLIVTSTAYRQSAEADAQKLAIDPSNQLYWKWPVMRLDAEIVRDRILATSGVLGGDLFGAPENLKVDDAGQVLVDGNENRRSVYVRVKRTQPVALLQSFDAPVMEVNCESRPSSTVAPQSLMMMNSDFILKQSKAFAQRLPSLAGVPLDTDSNVAALIEKAFELAYCRSPSESELTMTQNFLRHQLETIQATQPAEAAESPMLQAITNLCQVMLSSNEFLYIE